LLFLLKSLLPDAPVELPRPKCGRRQPRQPIDYRRNLKPVLLARSLLQQVVP
jgi:hypothetical protein